MTKADVPIQESALTRRLFLRRAGGAGLFLIGGGLIAACSSEQGAGASTIAPTSAAPANTTLASTTSAAAATTPSTPGAPEVSSLTTIRSSAVSWLWAPVDVATQQGFFEEEGLTNEDFASGRGENAPAVASGEADVLIGLSTSPMKANLQGQNMKIVAQFVDTYASNVVITDAAWTEAGLSESSSPEERAAALQGLRMGTTGPGAAPDLLIRYLMIELAGLDPNADAQLVPVQGGGSALLASVEADQIDGFCLSSPTSDQGVGQFGMHYLFDMTQDPVPELVGFPYIVAAVTDDFLQENPATVAAYVRGLQSALDFIHEEPDGFRDMMRELFGDALDDDTFQLAYEKNYPIYPTDLVMSEEGFTKAQSFLSLALEAQGAGGDFDPSTLSYEDGVETSFAVEASEN